ncbi:hypothetical protein [Capnocytophaga canimorsus]|uniref:hypothetical protein n=1 Tax=Capnocytophaga canimorsus TaxID=28188 RepID=UPI000F4FDCD3|nr:hypothetical protein [Capnocytophaga canimorsus]
MEFNIALNTVVYIMIFIFPGILFRKFFYIGEFSKEFYFGNLFERLMWTLFFSTLMLLCSFILYTSISNLFNWKLLSAISYEKISKIIEFLHSEKIQLPDEETFKKDYPDFFILLSAIYLMSALLGVATHYLAKLMNYNFYNYWHFLIKGKKHRNDLKNVKYSRTTADVLTDIQGDIVIYSGTIKDYHLTKNDTNLETIVLCDVTKKNGNRDVIPGHNFCIHKDNILNINLSYVYIETKQKQIWFKLFQNIISVVYIASLIVLLVAMYVNEDKFSFLNNWGKKITFFITVALLLSFVFEYIKQWRLPEKESIPVFLILLSIGTWLYLNAGFWLLFCLIFVAILITSLFNLTKKKLSKDKTK